MLEIKGKYNSAIVYASEVAENTIEQIKELLNQEFIKDSIIRIMPDCHYGAGCVIGTTMTIKDKVVPNLVGVDIGCGMITIELGKKSINFQELDNYIKTNIPSGMKVNDTILDSSVDIANLICYKNLKSTTYLKKSIGSLGGGNHFIEIDKDDENNYYLVIHSGSRNLGKQVAEIYQKMAIQHQKDKVFNVKEESKRIIKEYSENGRKKEIQAELQSLMAKEIELSMPESLCYLEGQLFDFYIHDMDICQKFAIKNREVMARKICGYLNLNFDSLKRFETIHNYINMEDMILRKGAIAAYQNQEVLIPINMRDGCIIGKGKACKDYNFSAPHGAGRLMSRKDASKRITLAEFQQSMKGIYSTSINESTIDESPFAYKSIESIISNIGKTVDIIKIIKPVYNFKAAE